MRKHLPSLTESLELLALAFIVGGLQIALRSWGWTALFSLGFIWNWSVLNGWVLQRSSEKHYRFSVLRLITLVHHLITKPFENYPLIKKFISVLPAGLFFALLAYLLQAAIPWWAAILGSLSFVLVRWQIAHIPRQ